MSSLYETDFYQWTIEQANLLRSGALSQLDIGNLIEEVESMGKSQKKGTIEPVGGAAGTLAKMGLSIGTAGEKPA